MYTIVTVFIYIVRAVLLIIYIYYSIEFKYSYPNMSIICDKYKMFDVGLYMYNMRTQDIRQRRCKLRLRVEKDKKKATNGASIILCIT